MMNLDNVIRQAECFAREVFAGDSGGHDYYHTMRVADLATAIAKKEGAEVKLVRLAALLHDVDDRKLSPETYEGKLRAFGFLRSQGVDEVLCHRILHIIDQISFSANTAPPDSLEAMCVQDADRLDAIGAIGIARAFAFGGSRGRGMYDPEKSDGSATIDHFYNKLLHLADRMTTAAGREMAHSRHAYMERFLDEFFAEWQSLR